MKRHSLRILLLVALVVAPSASRAQPGAAGKQAGKQPAKAASKRQPAGEGGIAIAPSRFELTLPPGTSKTVVLKVIHDKGPNSRGQRLLAVLNDWDLDGEGKLSYYKGGSRPNSAVRWILHSPVEMMTRPGGMHPVRITVTVPKNARPGDYTTAMIIEPRPSNIKKSGRHVAFRLRLAAILYVMVPPFKTDASLKALRAELKSSEEITVTALLENKGNHRVRPKCGVTVIDAKGLEVARRATAEELPVLRGHTLQQRLPVALNKPLGPGSYSVRYRINFGDGKATVEGRTTLSVP